MATAPTVQPSKTVFHTRGSWSARDDRIPSVLWLGILWAGMIAGFGLDIPAVSRRVPPLLLVALISAWDWYRGRLMRVFVLGAGALLASEILCSLLLFWSPWQSAATAFVQACANFHI